MRNLGQFQILSNNSKLWILIWSYMLEIYNSLLVQVKYITNIIEKLEDKP